MGIGEKVNSYYADKALNSVLDDESMVDAPISAKMGKLESALRPFGKYGQQVLQNRMAIEQQGHVEKEQAKVAKEESRIEKEREVLGRLVSGEEINPQDLKHVSPQNQLKVFEFKKKKEAGRSVKESLIKAGYPEETATLWQNQIENAPTGGQSDVIKNVNDLIRRSKSGKGLSEETQEKEQLKPSIEIPGVEMENLELDFPELPEPIGLTPADVVKQNEYREKVNSPLYADTVKHLNTLDEEFRDVSHLQDLNKSDKLPTGASKWNVDWESGDLKVKALATPEAQDYVKTIARMARRAKDFFPGRVTNFDLDQFKQGFATLANSPQGRDIISKQMALSNRIAYLEDETLKASIDHYGSGADPHLIRKYAQQNYRKLKGQLENQLKNVNKQASNMTHGIEKQKTEKPIVPLEKAKSLEDIFG